MVPAAAPAVSVPWPSIAASRSNPRLAVEELAVVAVVVEEVLFVWDDGVDVDVDE